MTRSRNKKPRSLLSLLFLLTLSLLFPSLVTCCYRKCCCSRVGYPLQCGCGFGPPSRFSAGTTHVTEVGADRAARSTLVVQASCTAIHSKVRQLAWSNYPLVSVVGCALVTAAQHFSCANDRELCQLPRRRRFLPTRKIRLSLSSPF